MRRRLSSARFTNNSASSKATSCTRRFALRNYDEAADLWQARVNREWRFYFTIAGDTYRIEDVIPHPK
jgi:hypothetical protein